MSGLIANQARDMPPCAAGYRCGVESGLVQARGSGAFLEWAVACAPKVEGDPCGDGFALLRNDDRVTFALADGAGSGRVAKAASDACLDEITKSKLSDLRALFQACHRRLVATRGAALAVVVVDLEGWCMEWAALGDIDGVLFAAQGAGTPTNSVIQRSGTLGFGKVDISPQTASLAAGQVIALSTDGVSRGYRDVAPHGQSVAAYTSASMAAYGCGGDDRTFAALKFGVQ